MNVFWYLLEVYMLHSYIYIYIFISVPDTNTAVNT